MFTSTSSIFEHAAKANVQRFVLTGTCDYNGLKDATYRITHYQPSGKTPERLPNEATKPIKPESLDEIARRTGYTLAAPPWIRTTAQLTYIKNNGRRPEEELSAEVNRFDNLNAKRAQEARILSFANLPPAEDRINSINVKGINPNEPGITYIAGAWGRWNASPFHNTATGTAEQRHTKFQARIDASLANRNDMYDSLVHLAKKLANGETITLGCWCNGHEDCEHAIIRNAVLELLQHRDPIWGFQPATENNPEPTPIMPPAQEPTTKPERKTFKLIVAGSRSFANPKLVGPAATKTHEKLMADELDASKAKLEKAGKELIIISGAAPGADRAGEDWAFAHKVYVQQYHADWDQYGKSAGYRRNEKMADAADGLIAFWDGKSPGTKHMIETAKARKLPVKIINYAAVIAEQDNCAHDPTQYEGGKIGAYTCPGCGRTVTAGQPHP